MLRPLHLHICTLAVNVNAFWMIFDWSGAPYSILRFVWISCISWRQETLIFWVLPWSYLLEYWLLYICFLLVISESIYMLREVIYWICCCCHLRTKDLSLSVVKSIPKKLRLRAIVLPGAAFFGATHLLWKAACCLPALKIEDSCVLWIDCLSVLLMVYSMYRCEGWAWR